MPSPTRCFLTCRDSEGSSREEPSGERPLACGRRASGARAPGRAASWEGNWPEDSDEVTGTDSVAGGRAQGLRARPGGLVGTLQEPGSRFTNHHAAGGGRGGFRGRRPGGLCPLSDAPMSHWLVGPAGRRPGGCSPGARGPGPHLTASHCLGEAMAGGPLGCPDRRAGACARTRTPVCLGGDQKQARPLGRGT